jgi:hypothetical protein
MGAYDKAKVSPFATIGTWHPLALAPSPSRGWVHIFTGYVLGYKPI